MKLNQFGKPFDGAIIIEEFNIKVLKNQSVKIYLKSLWEIHRMSETPVLIKAPFLKHSDWKRINLTNIYLTCDARDRDIETEFRKLLAPQPNIFQRIEIKISNFFSATRLEILADFSPRIELIRV